MENEFISLKLPKNLSTARNFSEFCSKNMSAYLNDKEYDPIAVSCAVRILIEKRVYFKLPEEFRENFLNTHKTKCKLKFAEEHYIEVPEIFYLLGVIYNDALHLNENRDNFSFLMSKLDNFTLKNMIKELSSMNL